MSGLTFICDHCESVHADMESYRRHVCADVWRDRALAGERLAKEVHEALGWPCPERECGCCQCGECPECQAAMLPAIQGVSSAFYRWCKWRWR